MQTLLNLASEFACCVLGQGTERDCLNLWVFRYSFICQGTSTRRQRSDLFGRRVNLPPVTTSLTTHR